MNSYNEEIATLSKLLLLSFQCEVIPKKIDLINFASNSKISKDLIFNFLDLIEDVSEKGIELADIETPVYDFWKKGIKEKPDIVTFYKSRGHSLADAKNLCNTYIYYRFVVDKFNLYENIKLFFEKGRSVLKEIFNLGDNQIFNNYSSHQDLLMKYQDSFSASHYFSDVSFIKKNNWFNSKKIIDIGGGNGSFGKILLKHFNCQYDLYELKGLIKAYYEDFVNFKSYHDNFNWIEGDFFYPSKGLLNVNKKYDCAILGWILHDWDDDKCIEILRKVKECIDHDGKIFIFEHIHDEKSVKSKYIDWLMLTMADGKERTIYQFEDLFEKVGLVIETVEIMPMSRGVICLNKKK